jgi:uncharacterized protein (TIGR02268 family)
VVRRIELTAEPSERVPEVRISPGIATVFVFSDAELLLDVVGRTQVELEQRENFERVEGADTMLQLIPSERLKVGAVARLVVRFKGKGAPAHASFDLVLHPVQADRLVEVYRNARTVESYQQELMSIQDSLRGCNEQLSQLRDEHGGPGGLTGLLALGLVGIDGVASRNLSKEVVQAQGNSLNMLFLNGFRAEKRVAVWLSVTSANEGAAPWMVEGATLTNRQGQELQVLSVWQSAPPVSGMDPWLVIVEAAVPERGVPGSWTLRLWEESSGRTATFGNISFQ